MAKYQSVNGAWPEGTREGRDLKPTAQEAVSAARRLYRFALKKTFRGKMRVTSGNRYTSIRSGVFHVNPDYNGGGWHELVHLISHQMASRLFPNAPGHGPQHAFLEKEMIRHVVESGWLDGKLRRPERAVPDRKAQRRSSVDRRIKAWETKRRRAETALRKLRAQQRRFERSEAAQAVAG